MPITLVGENLWSNFSQKFHCYIIRLHDHQALESLPKRKQVPGLEGGMSWLTLQDKASWHGDEQGQGSRAPEAHQRSAIRAGCHGKGRRNDVRRGKIQNPLPIL